MYGDAFWDASIYADRQLESNPDFAEMDEGGMIYRMLERENERLKRILSERTR